MGTVQQLHVEVKGCIDPNRVPDSAIEAGCRVLYQSIQLLFRQPGIQKEYEEWLAHYQREVNPG